MQKQIWKKHEWDYWILKDVELLGWMSNQNFKITSSSGVYFLRIEKKNISDAQYWGHFEKEYNISKELSLIGLAPKIYYFGVLCDTQYVIQEFIKDDDRDVSLLLLHERIKELHSLDLEKFHFLSRSSVYDIYSKKFNSRFISNTQLKSEYQEVQGFLNSTKDIKEKYVLCHGDLRRDNIISHNENISFIDWEWAYISDEAMDIVGYLMWNIFFEIHEYSHKFYKKYVDAFSYISKEKFRIYSILQFFSDLTWLENYIIANPDDSDKKRLFIKNKTFMNDLLQNNIKVW